MTTTTPRISLPLLAAAQAQKHVTHNDALLELDALLFARLLDRDLSAPPASPTDGDTYLVKATATGTWAGEDGAIAYAVDGAWRFANPFTGLAAYVVDEMKLIVFTGSAWTDYASILSLQNVPLLGVNTAADTTNKLTVKSSALLFDNIGNGVQAKLNKHAATDTASLLYQTNYSGRAELGLCGDDNFHFKVSPDGAAWTDAVNIDKTSGTLTLAGCAKLPNASAAAPALALNTNSGLFYDTTNTGVGIAVAGLETGWFAASGYTQSIPGGGTSTVAVQGEGITSLSARRYANDASAASINYAKARGSIASPAVPQLNDQLGQTVCQAYNGVGFSSSGAIRATLIETGTVASTALGTRWTVLACGIGSGTLTEIARFETGTGLSLFGANPVIDQNRAHRLRATTIAGAVAPSVAGNLFYHSDAQGGAGEVAVDTATSYRHAGQAALKKLTADADATYTPRADGRIVRDSAALTANRKLTLATTNVSDGHHCEVTRRGSSGGKTRDVYQADGTTLIVSLADNTSADFVYDAVAALWFQK